RSPTAATPPARSTATSPPSPPAPPSSPIAGSLAGSPIAGSLAGSPIAGARPRGADRAGVSAAEAAFAPVGVEEALHRAAVEAEHPGGADAVLEGVEHHLAHLVAHAVLSGVGGADVGVAAADAERDGLAGGRRVLGEEEDDVLVAVLREAGA